MVQWDEIKNEYIAGSSLETLSKKHGIKRDTIGTRCKRGHWQQEREKYNAERTEHAAATAERLGAEQDKRADKLTANIATAAEKLIAAALKGIDKCGDNMPPSALRDYTTSLKTALQIRDRVYGILSPEEKAHVDEMIADTKIKLEEHRLRMEQLKSTSDDVNVVFNDETRKYSE